MIIQAPPSEFPKQLKMLRQGKVKTQCHHVHVQRIFVINHWDMAAVNFIAIADGRTNW
jgi:hypothetical protein